jgi:hypothetical protein
MITILILFSTFIYAQDYSVLLKANSDLSGKQNYNYNDEDIDSDITNGISATVEIFNNYSEVFKIGVGTSFQLPRSIDADDANDFFFIPIYGAINIAVFNSDLLTTSIATTFGYSFFSGDSDYKKEFGLHGGLNWGVGFNTIINDLIIAEVLYKETNGNAVIRNVGNHEVAEINYSYVSVGVGLLFDL